MQSEETDIFACRLLSSSWEMHPCLVLTPFKQTSTMLVLKKLANMAAWRPIFLPFRYRSQELGAIWNERWNLRKLTFVCRLLSSSWEMHPCLVLTPFKQTNTMLVFKKLAKYGCPLLPVCSPFGYERSDKYLEWQCDLRKLTCLRQNQPTP